MKNNQTIIYCISFFSCIILIFLGTFIFFQLRYPVKFKEDILYYSIQYDLEPSLVASLINEESSYNIDALSKSGAVGLMQLKPSTALYICDLMGEDFDESKLYEADDNIRYGCFYLRYLKNKFEDDKVVLCAYNAGETLVSSWLRNKDLSKDGKELKKIPYKATDTYAKKVLSGKKHYAKYY